MTRWLSDFLVGRVIQVNMNGFLSDKIIPIAGFPQGSVLSPLLFLIYQNLTKDKPRNPSSLMTLLYGLLRKTYNLQQNFCVRTYENWQSGVPMENEIKSWKNQAHHILQVPSRKKFRTRAETVWRETQNLSSSEVSRNHFRLQIHFPKTLWGNPGTLKHQVSPNQTFSQLNMGTQHVHHITKDLLSKFFCVI